jgi:hypothetical protein
MPITRPSSKKNLSINSLARRSLNNTKTPEMTNVKPDKLELFQITWQFNKFIDNITRHFGYIDIDNDDLAKRALQLAPKYEKIMKSDKLFGHVMEYRKYDDEHIKKCPHCRIIHEAEQISIQISARRAAAWTAVADLDELWNGRRKHPGLPIEF